MSQKCEELSLPETTLKYRKKLERKHCMMTLVMVGAFLAAWSPYALCVLFLTIMGSFPDKLLMVSAYIAKSSTLFNPIIYSIYLKDFRRRCKKRLMCCYQYHSEHFTATLEHAAVHNMQDLVTVDGTAATTLVSERESNI